MYTMDLSVGNILDNHKSSLINSDVNRAEKDLQTQEQPDECYNVAVVEQSSLVVEPEPQSDECLDLTVDRASSISVKASNASEDFEPEKQEWVGEENEVELLESTSADVPIAWPVNAGSGNSVDEDDQSLNSDVVCTDQQQPADVRSWPFPRHTDGNIQANSSLSRISSDADFGAVESVGDSKQGGSLEGSEQCSYSESPLSYVIQLNEDSECSLPSEAGTSGMCPTGFDRILVGQVNCESESVDESIEPRAAAGKHSAVELTDSLDLGMEVDADSLQSDAAIAKENMSVMPVKNLRQKNRRSKKNKEKESEQGDDTSKVAKSKPRKKVSLASEVIVAQNGTDVKKGVYEYQWPQDDRSADWYLLQEHISEFLGVLSFKRKYPDIYRRSVDISERDFLQEQRVVTEMQCDLGLTALLADEVYDILEKDYPEKFKEYAKVLHKKEKQKAADHHKSSEMPTEKTKMENLLKKSIKSAADFNANLMRELRHERQAYFDLQTFEVHYPRSKMKILPSHATKIGTHPVAILPGQFQDYYKRYTPAELNYFPINTAIYSPHKILSSVYANPNAASTAVPNESDEEQRDATTSCKDEERAAEVLPVNQSNAAAAAVDVAAISQKVVVKEDSVSEPVAPPAKKVRRLASRKKNIETVTVIICSVCGHLDRNKLGAEEDLVKCSACNRSGHPTCLDLTSEMIPIIKTYDWQCMECKACVKCRKPHDEEKMMFCDHCDRGYHTFCVGVEEIPEGRWECPSCTLAAATPTPPKPKRGRPFKYPRPVVPVTLSQ